MLKKITIKNLVLIDQCSVDLSNGLTIITGETGAGKTAFTEAISLVLGSRSDHTLVRKGESKASIEAVFEASEQSGVKDLLHESGIDYDPSDFLFVKREIIKDGKNRCFINSQMVPLSVLQKLGLLLIDVISQHENKMLLSSDYHRDIVDLYGDLRDDVADLEKALTGLKKTKDQLSALKNVSLQKEREEEFVLSQLGEIENAQYKEGEEEALFAEYKKTASFSEIQEKIQYIQDGLLDSPHGIIMHLIKLKNTNQTLADLDSTLKESCDLMHESYANLKEASRLLDTYLHSLEVDESRFAFLEERLSFLSKFKKKYGSSFEEIENFKRSLEEKAQIFGEVEIRIEELNAEFLKIENDLLARATSITRKREKASQELESKITQNLQKLNMKEALFQIQISPQNLTSTGRDHVEFYLKTNKGEPVLKVKDCSSGGELARLMLAIKTALAEKNNTPTLIFDEIDANVGGETATLMGEQLQILAGCRQVFCITHFPQVARFGDNNLRIYKDESDGRTIAHVEVLDSKSREQELLRMVGGKKGTF